MVRSFEIGDQVRLKETYLRSLQINQWPRDKVGTGEAVIAATKDRMVKATFGNWCSGWVFADRFEDVGGPW